MNNLYEMTSYTPYRVFVMNLLIRSMREFHSTLQKEHKIESAIFDDDATSLKVKYMIGI